MCPSRFDMLKKNNLKTFNKSQQQNKIKGDKILVQEDVPTQMEHGGSFDTSHEEPVVVKEDASSSDDSLK